MNRPANNAGENQCLEAARRYDAAWFDSTLRCGDVNGRESASLADRNPRYVSLDADEKKR